MISDEMILFIYHEVSQVKSSIYPHWFKTGNRTRNVHTRFIYVICVLYRLQSSRSINSYADFCYFEVKMLRNRLYLFLQERSNEIEHYPLWFYQKIMVISMAETVIQKCYSVKLNLMNLLIYRHYTAIYIHSYELLS